MKKTELKTPAKKEPKVKLESLVDQGNYLKKGQKFEATEENAKVLIDKKFAKKAGK